MWPRSQELCKIERNDYIYCCQFILYLLSLCQERIAIYMFFYLFYALDCGQCTDLAIGSSITLQ